MSFPGLKLKACPGQGRGHCSCLVPAIREWMVYRDFLSNNTISCVWVWFLVSPVLDPISHEILLLEGKLSFIDLCSKQWFNCWVLINMWSFKLSYFCYFSSVLFYRESGKKTFIQSALPFSHRTSAALATCIPFNTLKLFNFVSDTVHVSNPWITIYSCDSTADSK